MAKRTEADQGTPMELYVSPQGNDAWSGRAAEPDPSGADGPLATLAGAQRAVRQLKGRGAAKRQVTVFLRAGTHVLDAPLRFAAGDSGHVEYELPNNYRVVKQDHAVVWRAFPGERPVVSGGVAIGNWRETTLKGRKAWVAGLPEVRGGKLRFRQLFVNGRRAPRTRLPREGFFRVRRAPDFKEGETSYFTPADRFEYAPGDLRRWKNLTDVEVVMITRWIENRLPIAQIDPRRRIVTFDRKSRMFPHDDRGKEGAVYWVENVLEALDTPGQWYLDRGRGKLYYLPRAGETPENTEIIVPRLPQLLRLAGTAKNKVHHIRFEGIAFAHTEWDLPPGWCGSNQAANEVPGAIALAQAHDCVFSDCSIEHVGGYGLAVGEGCMDIVIGRCRIEDLGAGGIKIGHESARTTVSDCTIAHGGRLFMSAVGVWVAHSPANLVVHNHIHDFYYTGISVGWVWGYAASKAVGNVIEHNHIHDLGHGLLSDMGGIYTLGVAPGTRLRFNLIHDVNCRTYGGWGIYPDEGSSHLLIEKNIAYRCNSAPFHQHYGRDNVVHNNIFAFGAEHQLQRSRIEDHTSFTFRRNIVYFSQGELMGQRELQRNCLFERNLYWDASGRPVRFYGKTVEEWQALGQDHGSRVADPLFADPEKGDFRLRPDSPAAAIGFEPFDLSDAGPRKRESLGS